MDRGDGSTSSEVDIKIGFSGISARCSFSQVFDVVNGFNDAKRSLVDECGFGGLLKFPALKKIDRRFALWLMCRVDVAGRALVIGESRKIKLTKGDVSLIFGIPASGKLVAGDGRPARDIVSKVSSEYLGIAPKEVRSIKAAQEVLTRSYGDTMSVSERCAFKAAFVIFVMSTVLAPGGKYDYLSVDYWDSVVDTDEIRSYDWSDYVVRRLFEAIIKLKDDVNAKAKVANISGCSLFLQVLYLDSIDLGSWTMPHNVFPRISAFGPDTLRAMIRMDTINYRSDSYERVYGKNKIRAKEGICYSWCVDQSDDYAQMVSGSRDALWKAIVSLLTIFSLPVEAARDLFSALSRMDVDVCLCAVSAVISTVEKYSKLGVSSEGPNLVDRSVEVVSASVDEPQALCSALRKRRLDEANVVDCNSVVPYGTSSKLSRICGETSMGGSGNDDHVGGATGSDSSQASAVEIPDGDAFYHDAMRSWVDVIHEQRADELICSRLLFFVVLDDDCQSPDPKEQKLHGTSNRCLFSSEKRCYDSDIPSAGILFDRTPIYQPPASGCGDETGCGAVKELCLPDRGTDNERFTCSESPVFDKSGGFR